MNKEKVAIIIPSRLASTRLKRKPLLSIAGKPMIIHVAEKALQADMGDVYVACADKEIADVCEEYGIKYVLSDPSILTGTDRVHSAITSLEQEYKYVVNLQGDLPSISPKSIVEVINVVRDNKADIGTLATIAKTEKEKVDPNMVRAIFTESGKALYFTRAANCPTGEGDCFHHVGIYAFEIEALKKFVSLPQSALEKREKLEQLRALENNMSIYVKVVDDFAHGVDTPEDFDIVKGYIENNI